MTSRGRAAAALCLLTLVAASCSSRAPVAVKKTPSAQHTTPRSTPSRTTAKPTAQPTQSPSVAQPRAHVTLFATLPHPVSRSVAFFGGNSLIVAGGELSGGSTTDQILSVDLANARVTPAGKLARATHDAGGAVLLSHDYVFGGGSATTTDLVQVFEAGSNGKTTSRLPQPRSDLAVVTDGVDAYIVGGYDGKTLLPDVLHTHDGKTFDVVAKLPVPVRYPAVAYTGDAIYVFGGQTGSAGTEITDVQRIDLQAGTARVIGHMARALAHASALAVGTNVYVLGGVTAGKKTARVLRFDLGTNRFHTAGTLPVALSDYALTSAQGTAYLVGGETSSGSTDAVYRVYFS